MLEVSVTWRKTLCGTLVDIADEFKEEPLRITCMGCPAKSPP